MSIPFILIATVCYLMTSISNLRQKDFPMAFVWFGYAMANTGFIWYEYKKMM